MPEEPDNVVLIYLRRLNERLDGLHEDNREIETRLGILEQQGASLSSRIDRIELRLDRIEKRLDLVEV
jgi:predicted  nucleic acid-binding Zn-ribbon protein